MTSYDYDSPVSESGELTKIRFSKTNGDGTQGPGFCRSQFVLRRSATLFWTRAAGEKAWINGHALGRFWNLGPQQTRYEPASWLRKGTNDVVVFTEDQPKSRHIGGLRAPVLDEVSRE